MADPASFTGKSYRLTYVDTVQAGGRTHVEPVARAGIFVRSPAEVSARLTYYPNNPAKTQSRFFMGAPGTVDRGVQVIFDNGLQLVATAGGGSYRIKAVCHPRRQHLQRRDPYEMQRRQDAVRTAQFRYRRAAHDDVVIGPERRLLGVRR